MVCEQVLDCIQDKAGARTLLNEKILARRWMRHELEAALKLTAIGNGFSLGCAVDWALFLRETQAAFLMVRSFRSSVL